MASRYRKVNLYGNRYVVELMKVDIEDLKLSVGDELDISSVTIRKEDNQ